ncbi:hypothetical protein BDW71DRAFT_118786 [Aspergillus fruticulosus]
MPSGRYKQGSCKGSTVKHPVVRDTYFALSQLPAVQTSEHQKNQNYNAVFVHKFAVRDWVVDAAKNSSGSRYLMYSSPLIVAVLLRVNLVVTVLKVGT